MTHHMYERIPNYEFTPIAINTIVAGRRGNHRIVHHPKKDMDVSSYPSQLDLLAQNIIMKTIPRRPRVAIWYDRLKEELAASQGRIFELRNEGEKISTIPFLADDRPHVIMVVTSKGSDESTWCGQYAREYRRLFPKNDIWIFSTKKGDPTLDCVEGIKRFRMDCLTSDDDPAGLEMPKVEELANSLCIMDDICDIRDHGLRKCAEQFRDRLISHGRSRGISVIGTLHILCSGPESKKLRVECDSFVFFPTGIRVAHVREYLFHMIGLDENQVNRIMSYRSNGRWTYVRMNPRIAITEERAIVL